MIAVYADGENEDGASSRTGAVPTKAAPVAVAVETLRRYAGDYTAPIGNGGLQIV